MQIKGNLNQCKAGASSYHTGAGHVLFQIGNNEQEYGCLGCVWEVKGYLLTEEEAFANKRFYNFGLLKRVKPIREEAFLYLKWVKL